MSFLKTLTCKPNQSEPQIARLVSQTAYRTRSTERDQDMKKTLITSSTVLALILSVGMSMAGPLRGHDQRGHPYDVRSAVSQTRTHGDTKPKFHQTIKKPARGYGSTSDSPIDEDCVDACTDALS